jgi:hypothetical protein
MKGGAYNIFTGRDATRAFVTGCFLEHLTHDLRGLSEEQLQELDKWVEFYKTHKEYKFVGMLRNPPIDPESEIPKMCSSH